MMLINKNLTPRDWQVVLFALSAVAAATVLYKRSRSRLAKDKALLAQEATKARVIQILRRSTKEDNKNDDTLHVKVFGFNAVLPLDPDLSPACIKLLTFLKLTGLPYTYLSFEQHGFTGSPRGKVPWMEIDIVHPADGSATKPDRRDTLVLSDSDLIIDFLVQANPERFDLNAARKLTPKDAAVGTALTSLMQDSLYWIGLHVRWNTSEFARTTCQLYFGHMPAMVRNILAYAILRPKLCRDLRGQGTGLWTEDEIYAKARREIGAVADFLHATRGNGSKVWCLGTPLPTRCDATVYGHLVLLVQGEWNHPIFDFARNQKPIMDYVNFVREQVWPELMATQQ